VEPAHLFDDSPDVQYWALMRKIWKVTLALLWRTRWRRRPGARRICELSGGKSRVEGGRCDHQPERRTHPHASELREKLLTSHEAKSIKLGVLRNKSAVTLTVRTPGTERVKRAFPFRTHQYLIPLQTRGPLADFLSRASLFFNQVPLSRNPKNPLLHPGHTCASAETAS